MSVRTTHPLDMNDEQRVLRTMVAPSVPAIIIDDFFARPDEAREFAMALDYRPAESWYPGRLAACEGEAIDAIGSHLLDIVNTHYLTAVDVRVSGQRVEVMSEATIDFAIVDTPSAKLAAVQRLPHVDEAPLFALVYLNPTPQGGTLFFERDDHGEPVAPRGYCGPSVEGYRHVGKIEGRYNRLALYPGFHPHSGEIDEDDLMARLSRNEPRVTMRAVFDGKGRRAS